VNQVFEVKIRYRLALLFKPSMIRRTVREGERAREREWDSQTDRQRHRDRDGDREWEWQRETERETQIESPWVLQLTSATANYWNGMLLGSELKVWRECHVLQQQQPQQLISPTTTL